MWTVQLGDRTCDLRTRALVMGILNRTPDSFFDQGRTWSFDAFLRRADDFVAQGADILDVGGVKAGPGEEVGEAEELDRVVPAVEALRARFDVPISADTWRASVLDAACRAGAVIGNDISGFADPDYLPVAARAGATVVATHIRLRPRVPDPDPRYDDLVPDVERFLLDRAHRAEAAGIPPARIVVDAGLDLGKNRWQSAVLLRESERLRRARLPTAAVGVEQAVPRRAVRRPRGGRPCRGLAGVGGLRHRPRLSDPAGPPRARDRPRRPGDGRRPRGPRRPRAPDGRRARCHARGGRHVDGRAGRSRRHPRAGLGVSATETVVVVRGRDATLRGEALHALVTELVGGDDRTLAVAEFDVAAPPESVRAGRGDLGAEAALVLTALDAARTIPFGSSRRIVVLRNAAQLAADDTKPIAAYVAAAEPTSVLVLEYGDKAPPAALSKALKAVDAREVSADEPLATVLAQHAKAAGLRARARRQRGHHRAPRRGRRPGVGHRRGAGVDLRPRRPPVGRRRRALPRRRGRRPDLQAHQRPRRGRPRRGPGRPRPPARRLGPAPAAGDGQPAQPLPTAAAARRPRAPG